MGLNEELESFFDREGIEYVSLIPYSECKKIRPDIMEREGFVPRSAIVFLIPYYGGETVNLSRYAAARDYHIYIKDVTERLCEQLSSSFPGALAHGYGDHSPIDERHAALIGGLGILGDNGLIINERYGSYVFVADVLTDIPTEKLGVARIEAVTRCEGCGACRLSCPTGILRGEGEDCLSAITQRKGELTEEEVLLMRRYNTVWGCDLCQSTCPHNRAPRITPIRFFTEDRMEELTCEVLDGMDKSTFNQRAFSWRGRKTVERNIELVCSKKVN